MFENDRIVLQPYLNYFNLIESDLCVINKDHVVVMLSEGYAKRHGISEKDMIGMSVYELEANSLFLPSVGKICIQEGKKVTVVQTNPRGDTILSTATPIFDERGSIEYILCYNTLDIADCVYGADKFEKASEIIHTYLHDAHYSSLENNAQISLNTRSKSMHRLLDIVDQIADTTASVLITGETGVGKSMFAKLIHQKSSRADKPFIEINCGSIPENLIESELFGYESGAFTGASQKGKQGKIELADGGTLFLDEISEMSAAMQTKFLQVLQNKVLTRVGGTKQHRIDFRLITATNKDLQNEINLHNFRDDLYYRLNVIPIEIPPVRERTEDIFPLVMHFLNHFNSIYNKKVELTLAAMKLMEAQKWPGNVREIENFTERLVVLSHHSVVSAAELPFGSIKDYVLADTISNGSHSHLRNLIEEYEKQIFVSAFEQFKTSVAVGEYLGISQTSAARKLRKYVPNYHGR